MSKNEWNVFKRVEGGAWHYHVESEWTEVVYVIAAADTEKLVSGLGVERGDIEKAWLDRFGTGERNVALQWLKENDIMLTTDFVWMNELDSFG